MNPLYLFLISNNLIRKIAKGLVAAICLSLFIYLYHFGVRNIWVYTILGIFSLFYYLKSDRSYRFFFGFFVGILWFYWVPFSFRFFGVDYLIPLAVVGIGIFYGLLFYIVLYFQNVWYRAILLFFLPYFAPFGFDWLNLRAAFVLTPLNISNIGYALIILSIVLMVHLKGSYRLLSVLVLIFSLLLFPKPEAIPSPPIKIEIVSTDIPQGMRWQKDNTDIIENNFKYIDEAILANQEVVILPETAFPMNLEYDKNLVQRLLQKSKSIAIVTGAIYITEINNKKETFNSLYVFNNGRMQRVDKSVLVPFGEYMPMPLFLKEQLLKFLNIGEFRAGKTPPIDIQIGGELFRMAICYEATQEKFFINSPKYMIAISNNAWFTPSIQPSLQELLMLMWGKIYQTMIFHSSNGAESLVLIPHLEG
ncbi:apolipoprotein N-acyltransferase [Helicobacter monodelphidis]|uniref:apolipoprotein N-acyltransferase n=1 Tax=Helicobacter sp. 15-1451 TaxID=2004995 RepID=UPI0015EC23C8|nr:apolipoprotein N-acyltransferase [Helicobacter sp. 15-1451]